MIHSSIGIYQHYYEIHSYFCSVFDEDSKDVKIMSVSVLTFGLLKIECVSTMAIRWKCVEGLDRRGKSLLR